jgi:aminomethyltransferase
VLGEGRQPLRDGALVRVEGREVGVLSSGNFSPMLERGIGLGLLDETLEVGTPLTLELRGRDVKASVAALPFVRKVK